MINQLFLYSIINKKFYEDYSQKSINNDFINIILPKINKNWTTEKSGVYYNVYYSRNVPSQGWKIHISAILDNAKEILDIASDILIENKMAFKFLFDMETLKMTSQKAYPRQSYGKFITIYPRSVEEFKFIINTLYEALKNFEGPYILSDKRYLDCKVIYYRYGGILPNFKYDTEGKAIPFILDGNSNEIEDRRLPYFFLPDGIDDIFNNNINDSSLILTKEYEIVKPIKFTNAGGVYLAKKKSNNQSVIIKEARPYTGLIDEGIDTIYVRKEELNRLKELQHTGFVPIVIDAFYDWEHYFIVEEYIEGFTLDEFVVKNDPFPRLGTEDQVKVYMENIIKIFIKIAEFISILHKDKMIYSDFSLENIMLTPTFDVKIIDLEGCVHDDSNAYRTVTKGFYDYIETKNLYASDIYGLGCLLFSCILKKTNMLDIQPNTIEIFLNSIYEEYYMPLELKKLIIEMTVNDVNKRPNIDKVKICLSDILLKLKCNPIIKKNLEFNIKDLENELSESIHLGLKGITKSKFETSMCMFPNTPILTCKLNISAGLSGIIYGLNYLGDSSYNDDFLNYSKKVLNNDPIGLYVGLSGIIWTMLEIGEIAQAQELFHKYIFIDKVKNDYSIFSGISGIGLLCIKLYLHTNDNRYLNIAVNCGKDIISNLQPKSIKYIGYKKGLSGISLFLLYLYMITKNDSFFSFGKEILLYELDYQVTYDSFKDIDFPSYKGSNIASPYFIEGTSGILSVLLRYYSFTKSIELHDYSRRLADSLFSKYTVSPTLFRGLAGIGNTLLDCYYILEDEKYKKIAYVMARECMQHQIKYQDGVLFPDLYINKLSTDFGYGTIGILMFFHRLLNNERKNFCLFIDEISTYRK